MTLKEFRDSLTAKGNQIDELMRRQMPVVVGQMAVSHFKSNFRQGGFMNDGLHPWQKSKRIGKGQGAGSNYKTLLSGRNHLYSSINYIPGDGRVTIQNNVEYAAIHNEGGTIESNPTVTPKMKKFAWAKYYAALNGQKPNKNTSIPEDAARWRALALTKKTKLNIKAVMPKRQFIGDSKELNEKIQAKLEEKLEKVFNS